MNLITENSNFVNNSRTISLFLIYHLFRWQSHFIKLKDYDSYSAMLLLQDVINMQYLVLLLKHLPNCHYYCHYFLVQIDHRM